MMINEKNNRIVPKLILDFFEKTLNLLNMNTKVVMKVFLESF